MPKLIVNPRAPFLPWADSQEPPDENGPIYLIGGELAQVVEDGLYVAPWWPHEGSDGGGEPENQQ